MSAPKYDSSNYDKAAEEYNKAVLEYSGENGNKKARAAASSSALQQGQQAGEAAMAANRSAGMTRGQAAAAASGQAANTASNAYQEQYNKQQELNQEAIKQRDTRQFAAQKDENLYNSNQNRYNTALGAGMGAFSTLGMFASDERTKKIATIDDFIKRLKEC